MKNAGNCGLCNHDYNLTTEQTNLHRLRLDPDINACITRCVFQTVITATPQVPHTFRLMPANLPVMTDPHELCLKVSAQLLVNSDHPFIECPSHKLLETLGQLEVAILHLLTNPLLIQIECSLHVLQGNPMLYTVTVFTTCKLIQLACM